MYETLMLLPETNNEVSSIDIIVEKIGCVITVMYVIATGKAQNKADENVYESVDCTQNVTACHDRANL